MTIDENSLELTHRDDERGAAAELSSEEWSVVRALRQAARNAPPHAYDNKSPNTAGLDARLTFEQFEQGVFERVTATLDRMLVRADRTSCELDGLLRRLAETSPARRPAA